jgi:hypothetical protein
MQCSLKSTGRQQKCSGLAFSSNVTPVPSDIMANNESIVNFNAEKIAEHVALLAVPDCMAKCNPFDAAHMQRCVMIDLHAFLFGC